MALSADVGQVFESRIRKSATFPGVRNGSHNSLGIGPHGVQFPMHHKRLAAYHFLNFLLSLGKSTAFEVEIVRSIT